MDDLREQADVPKCAPCVQCGAIFTGHGNRKVCGDKCAEERDRKRAAAWYAARRDHYREGMKAASRRRYEKVRADADLLARQRAMTADWRSRNRDQMREQERRWRAENPEAVREKLHRRRARQMGLFVAEIDRDALWERDGGLCGICGDPIDRSVPWPDRMCATVDHIVALADGGTHEPANAQLAHMHCNARKGARVQRPEQTPCPA